MIDRLRVRGLRVVAWICAIAAATGMIFVCVAPLRLAQSVAIIGDILAGRGVVGDPTRFAEHYHAVLAPVEAFVGAWPWLWPLLGGAALVLRGSAKKKHMPIRHWQWALVLLMLGAALACGARIRFAPLLDREAAITWRADYDEGVYVSFARLWSSGVLPYRDTWASHPPTGLALLAPIAAASPSGEDALANSRRANALLDLVAGALVVWIAWQLGGAGAGTIAGSLYVLDSFAGRNANHVWLETSVNMWSLAALGCGLHGLSTNRQGWLVAAGALGVLAATTKYTGVALPAALVLALVAFRRWRMLGALVAGATACVVLYALLLLPLGWHAFVQQTLIAQLLRPASAIDLATRLGIIFDSIGLATGLAGALGACVIVLRRSPEALGWSVVLLWLTLSLALATNSPTFYAHYATQLVPPLALLGGGLAWSASRLGRWRWLVGAGIALLLAPLLVVQQVMPREQFTPEWAASGRTIRAETLPNAPLASFDPMYNLLADRPFARAADGRLLIDSYMHLRWLHVDWANTDWDIMVRAVLQDAPLPVVSERDPVLGMLQAAQYAVFNEFRTVQVKEQVVALAGNFRATPLATGVLYSRSTTPRHFTAETVRMRGVLVPTVAKAGETLAVSMFWQKPVAEDRQPFVSLQLIGANDTKAGQYDKPIGPAEAGLQAWSVGLNTYQDDVALPIAPEAPPGEYRLLMVVYEPATGTRWSLSADDGNVEGITGAPLGEVIELERVVIE